VGALLTAIGSQLDLLSAGGKDFDYWDQVHGALESYP
jgi:hypothetical protein